MASVLHQHRNRTGPPKIALVSFIACLTAAMTAAIVLSSIFAMNAGDGTMTGLASHSSRLATQITERLLMEQQESLQDSNEEYDEEIETIQLAPHDQESIELTILPDELPGYTGWARPLSTLVDWFRIVNVSEPVATVGQDWSVYLECTHQACRKGGSLFDVRAFGRAVLPGRMKDHENGQYTITILPHDIGHYTLEVVLACSFKPDWTELPNEVEEGETYYEGFLLPGFPIQFTVVDKTNESRQGQQQERALLQQSQSLITSRNNKSDPSATVAARPIKWCTAQQMVETSTHSAIAAGRWLVVNKTQSLRFITPGMTNNSNVSYMDTEGINFANYYDSLSSSGFQMDYFPLECDLLPLSHVTKPATWLAVLDKHPFMRNTTSSSTSPNNKKKAIHILFVGDSNTRREFTFFNRLIVEPTNGFNGRLRVTYVDMIGFWDTKYPVAKEILFNITQEFKDDMFFTIFNIGLHEIMHRCTILGMRWGRVPEGPCYEAYQKDVQALVELVQSLPSVFNLWQSTVAGWPRWGVYGISWRPKLGQEMSMDPHICEYFNGLAWDIVKKAGIPVMDMYWLTVSRADHRENYDDAQAIRTEYKLVHLGPEVYRVLVRKVSTIILEFLEKGVAPGQHFL